VSDLLSDGWMCERGISGACRAELTWYRQLASRSSDTMRGLESMRRMKIEMVERMLRF